MKANYKYRVPPKTQKAVQIAVEEEYEKIKKEHEQKAYDKFYFMFMLGTAIVLHENLGYGPKRRKDIVQAIADKINEISAYLAGNKVVEADTHEESYDIDYNREYLRRLSDEYGVPFDEEVFNDDF